jgi:hypothetical protein
VYGVGPEIAPRSGNLFALSEEKMAVEAVRKMVSSDEVLI